MQTYYQALPLTLFVVWLIFLLYVSLMILYIRKGFLGLLHWAFPRDFLVNVLNCSYWYKEIKRKINYNPYWEKEIVHLIRLGSMLSNISTYASITYMT
jgi:hypothetical protein